MPTGSSHLDQQRAHRQQGAAVFLEKVRDGGGGVGRLAALGSSLLLR